jgi:hypothetical protein
MKPALVVGEVTASAADVAKMHLVCRIDRVPANCRRYIRKLKEMTEYDRRQTATPQVRRFEQ